MNPIFVAAAASLLAGCAALPPAPLAGRDPADPSAHAAPVRHRPVMAGTADYRPVAPKPWAEQNRGVTSKPTEGM